MKSFFFLFSVLFFFKIFGQPFQIEFLNYKNRWSSNTNITTSGDIIRLSNKTYVISDNMIFELINNKLLLRKTLVGGHYQILQSTLGKNFYIKTESQEALFENRIVKILKLDNCLNEIFSFELPKNRFVYSILETKNGNTLINTSISSQSKDTSIINRVLNDLKRKGSFYPQSYL